MTGMSGGLLAIDGEAGQPGRSRQPAAWIRLGVGVAAASYAAAAAYGLLALRSVLWVRVTESAAAVVLLAALALSYRRPLAAAAVTIATVWAELVLSVGLVGTVAPAMYAFPVLVVGAGILLGGRMAAVVAGASAAAIPAAAWV